MLFRRLSGGVTRTSWRDSTNSRTRKWNYYSRTSWPKSRRAMSSNSKENIALSTHEKRALLAELLRKKGEIPKAFPVSFAQQRLWFLDQMEPNNPFYNIVTAVRLRGRLDV